MEPIEWAKVGQLALHYLRKFWYVVPILALGIALHVTRGTLSSREHTIAAQAQTISNQNARNAITQRSLDGALKEIDRQNADITAAAARLQADRAKATADEARLAERAKGTDGTIAALTASSKLKHDRCVVSPTARKALESLQ